MIKLNKGRLVLFVVSCLILLSIMAIGVYVYLESQRWLRAGYQIEELEDRKDQFDVNPNIDDCFFIVSRSIGIKEHKDTIDYGRKCIDLGINNTPGGFLVNCWMAVSFKELEKNELAKQHLSIALKLDKENRILNNKWIEKMNIVGIYDRLESDESKDDGVAKSP